MNNKVLSIFSFIAIAFCVILTLACSNGSDQQTEDENQSSDLPKMTVTSIGGEKIALNTLSGKVVIVVFQPDCEDCQREAVHIRNNIGEFEGYTLYFISTENMTKIASFADYYRLSPIDNMVFAQATVEDVTGTLGQITTPSIFIYGDQGELVKSFNGEVGIDQIKSHL